MTDIGPSELVREQRHLTLVAAQAVLDASVGRATELGVAAVIVVTDASGGITVLARLDGTPPTAIRHAVAKAGSASGLARSTDEFLEKRLTQDDTLWRAISGRGDAFVVPGGFALKLGGKTIGAVGVATARHEHDSDIAGAGVAAFDALHT